jgi:hypothetical protein
MRMARIIFLNKNQALSGRLGRLRLPRECVLLAKAFGCGAIDRTKTLDLGFDYRVIDPLPSRLDDSRSFSQLCDESAANILAEAMENSRQIRVFWSGGIDSTVALVALMRGATARDRSGMIEVLVSTESVKEYPYFFKHHVDSKYTTTLVKPPLSQFLDPQKLNVTGEMGDQLFGSYLLREFVDAGIAHISYQDILPFVLTKKLGKPKFAEQLMRYLHPQILRCPVRLETLFDYYWWINFSLKWQQVALRLQVFRQEQIREVDAVTRHFFRGHEFQNWALNHPEDRGTVTDWRAYKRVGKKYIHDFTGDDDYLAQKTKEPSLKMVMFNAGRRDTLRSLVYMDEKFRAKFRHVNRGGKSGSR